MVPYIRYRTGDGIDDPVKSTVALLVFNLIGLSALAQQEWTEVQLTHDAVGHTIHNTQVFSPDNEWIVFDGRNKDTQIGCTGIIGKVHVKTKEIAQLYQTTHQTEFGPGVGAATYCPTKPNVLFIHGIRNSDASRPYSVTRRTGLIIDERDGSIHFPDARNTVAPFTPGALRGGTHAHSWSADGLFISCTYNDFILEQLEGSSKASVKDLRVIAVLAPGGPVQVPADADGENQNGDYFSVVVTRVTESPRLGSDEIDRAFDEGWIGTHGYQKLDGLWQQRAIAFLGNVRDKAGNMITEVFVVDLPEDLTKAMPGFPLEGTATMRPQPPIGTLQRRITFTTDRQFPGVQGVRHWLRSLPDGSQVFFLMLDEQGIAQIYGVSPNGGPIRQVTHHSFSIQTPFNISPNGRWIAYGADNSVFITKIGTGETTRLTPRSRDEDRPENGVVWSSDGRMLAYNRYVTGPIGRFLQIFILFPTV